MYNYTNLVQKLDRDAPFYAMKKIASGLHEHEMISEIHHSPACTHANILFYMRNCLNAKELATI